MYSACPNVTKPSFRLSRYAGATIMEIPMSAAVRIATASASRTIASAYVSSDEIASFPVFPVIPPAPFVCLFAICCPSPKIRHTPIRAYGEKTCVQRSRTDFTSKV